MSTLPIKFDMKKITVIVTFLNEGIEVYNTVKSIRDHSNIENVDIILIDDCSYDGYDYRRIAKIFNAAYYKHCKRIGVAESRNEAVNLSNTEYFILLDAHMRVYQNDWDTKIIKAIQNNPESIICCQTISLGKGGKPNRDSISGYGAYIDFTDLSVKWNKIDLYPQSNESIIPCVLGASYASSQYYWNKIKGIKGLKSYGFDEQLMSIKSWLAGGNCILIKDVSFGHIYRTKEEVPYSHIDWDYMYNKYYILKLFFDSRAVISDINSDVFKIPEKKIYKELENNMRTINSQLLWYKKIFKRNITEIVEMNNEYKYLNRSLI